MWLVVAIDVRYCNHFRIVYQLVRVIAMALWSCINIDFRCNYLVLLQLYLDLVAFACSYCNGYSELQ